MEIYLFIIECMIKRISYFVGTKLKKCMIESERQQIIELIKKK